MNPVSHARLKELLHYEPLTGIFTWRVDMGTRVRAGDIAGRINNGQRHIGLNRKLYNAGMLAWFYMTGEWPEEIIDHKNIDGDDNRWVNLRKATWSQNQANRFPRANRKRRFTGVSFHPSTGKWAARLSHNKKEIALGLFHNEEVAALARDRAALKYFGEFAVLNLPTAPKRDWIWLYGER